MKTSMSGFQLGPHTRAGKWSLGLILAMPVLFLIGLLAMNILYPTVPAGNSILEDFASRPALASAMLLGMAAGILAFLTGWMAIANQKERSLFVYISTAIGALLLVFLLGEILSPH